VKLKKLFINQGIKLNSGDIQFPRELSSQEKFLIFSVLPENKPGYKACREKIEKLMVIGYGRFKNNNYILGKKDVAPDLSVSSASVFASGTIIIQNDEVDVLVHEEYDDQIEFDISLKNSETLPEIINVKSKWSYSDWNSGDESPGDNNPVREISLSSSNYILVFAPSHKKIWLNEKESGVNYLIPLTNFYNELMGYKKIRDPKEALNPKLLFQNLSKFSDDDLIYALILYNRYMTRFPINFLSYLKPDEAKPKKSFKDLFKKVKN